MLSTPQKTPVDPGAVEQLVQDELRYREQRAASAALLAALPAGPLRPSQAASVQPVPAAPPADAEEDEEAQSELGRLSMASVQQWLHSHAPRDRRAALPVTHSFAPPPAPVAGPRAPARLLAALRSPARPLATFDHLRAYADNEAAAVRLLVELLAFSPDSAVSMGALAAASALLHAGGPRLSSGSSPHAFLLQWAASGRPASPPSQAARTLLAACDWQRLLAAHGAQLAPATLVASDEQLAGSGSSQPAGAAFVSTANITSIISFAAIASLVQSDEAALALLVRFACRLLIDHSLARTPLLTTAAPVLRLLLQGVATSDWPRVVRLLAADILTSCCANAFELAELTHEHLLPLSARGRELGSRVTYLLLQRELPRLVAPPSVPVSGALMSPLLPDDLTPDSAVAPATLQRVVAFLHQYHSAARQRANYFTMALVTLLLNTLTVSSVPVFFAVSPRAFEELIFELNVLNASIRETRVSDPLLSLTKETLVHLSTELVSLTARKAKQATVDQFLRKPSIKSE